MANAGAPKGGAKTGLIQTPIMTQAQYFIHYIPADRWKEAIAFFETTIGLMLRTNMEPHWAEFAAGGLTFALHPKGACPAGSKGDGPRDTGLCFAADDCDRAVEALRSRGVKGVTDPKNVSDEPGAGRYFEFEDPFGNTFSGYGK